MGGVVGMMLAYDLLGGPHDGERMELDVDINPDHGDSLRCDCHQERYHAVERTDERTLLVHDKLPGWELKHATRAPIGRGLTEHRAPGLSLPVKAVIL